MVLGPHPALARRKHRWRDANEAEAIVPVGHVERTRIDGRIRPAIQVIAVAPAEPAKEESWALVWQRRRE